mmetsp:Transcript_64217/g.57736  ORF Transcript_64217/g.57736 Transcript_64217/m.57736 type:complete len:264 (-) Transcript_64217:151-942(-)
MGNTLDDALSDNKQYYQCPSCNERVWAYGSFVGSKCFKCQGINMNMNQNNKNPNSKASSPNIDCKQDQALTADKSKPTPKSKPMRPMAQFQGYQVFKVQFGKPDFDVISDIDKKERIISIVTRSCEILPESWRDIAKAAKSMIDKDNNLDNVEHWWCNIETRENYYMIQFRGNSSLIEIRRCKNKKECDESGLSEANQPRDEKIWTQDYYSYPWGFAANKTINDLCEWLKYGGFSSQYHLINNNCQDLCRAMYKWCGEDDNYQ